MIKKTLAVIDVQNEFCHPDGFFAKNLLKCNPEGFFGKDKLTSDEIDKTVSTIEHAITHCRNAGIPVVYVQAVGDPEYLSPLRFERYKEMYEQGFLKGGTWSTEFYRIQPEEGERVFKKGGYDPFSNPEFKEHVLKTSSSLVLTGFFSDVCIDAAARTADQIGIPTEVIADCSLGLFRPHQENLKFMKMFYGTRIHANLGEFIAENNNVYIMKNKEGGKK